MPWSGCTPRCLALVVVLAVSGISPPLIAAEARMLTARDTLSPPPPSSELERRILQHLTWEPREFPVSLTEKEGEEYQALLRFPSPFETGDAENDRVAVLWYRAAKPSEEGKRKAVVVVHESGSAMPVGKMFARGFAARGVDAFLVQLPYYGFRRANRPALTEERVLIALRQGIADVRRARDAVAALADIDSQHISLQGTSLGGFVSATVAGLDHGFDRIFIMVAGGDLYSLLEHGQRESADLKRRLDEVGYTGEKLRQILDLVEPNHLAHRIDPQRTWLYSATQDQVVPLANALSFKEAARLSDDHHIRLWGDHVTTIVYFPVIADHVVQQMGRRAEK